jgi:hypothetical protein
LDFIGFIPAIPRLISSAYIFSKLDLFFKKNEEVIWPQHGLNLSFKIWRKGAPQYFWHFYRIERIYFSNTLVINALRDIRLLKPPLHKVKNPIKSK